MFVTEQFGQDIDEYVAYMKLEAKFPFLLSNDTSRLRLWSKWYSEANPYIMSNKNVSLRNRCLQWCAWKIRCGLCVCILLFLIKSFMAFI